MKQGDVRREMLRDFAKTEKLAREEGDLESWRSAVNEWHRLATRGEIKRAPGYMKLH